jgi:hypothetical protein
MTKPVSDDFVACFSKLDDPRIDRKKLYPLQEVLFVVLCGSICGAESWRVKWTPVLRLGGFKLQVQRG